ncbi:MAG: hypothetical protein ACJAVR_002354 [Paracoccaceae bacterium]|jgi:hypothetical protein
MMTPQGPLYVPALRLASRRAALRALLGAGALAACGREPGGANAGDPDALPPLPGPEVATPHHAAPDVLLLRDDGGPAIRGWVMGGSAPTPFILDPALGDAPPVVFLGGDRKGWGAAAMTPIWRAQARAGLARTGLARTGLAHANVAGTLITLGRPYAGDPSRWRTRAEISTLAHALGALGWAFGFGRADLLGHSSGGHLAVALAQETGRVRFLSAAAPPLDLITWHKSALRGASAAVRAQYDPVDHVAAFRADAGVIVADPLDAVAPPRAWQGWLGRALALGKPVTLMLAEGGGPDRHGLIGPGAEAMAMMRATRHP